MIYREAGYGLARDWKNFDPVKRGEVTARLPGGGEWTAPEVGYIIMPFEGAKHGEEWYYLAVPA